MGLRKRLSYKNVLYSLKIASYWISQIEIQVKPSQRKNQSNQTHQKWMNLKGTSSFAIASDLAKT